MPYRRKNKATSRTTKTSPLKSKAPIRNTASSEMSNASKRKVTTEVTKASSEKNFVEFPSEISLLSSDDDDIATNIHEKFNKKAKSSFDARRKSPRRSISSKKKLPVPEFLLSDSFDNNLDSKTKTAFKVKRGLTFDYDGIDIHNSKAQQVFDSRIAEFKDSLRIRREELNAVTSEEKNSQETSSSNSSFIEGNSNDCLITEEITNIISKDLAQNLNTTKKNAVNVLNENPEDYLITEVCPISPRKRSRRLNTTKNQAANVLDENSEDCLITEVYPISPKRRSSTLNRTKDQTTTVFSENPEDCLITEVCPISPRRRSSRLNTIKDQTTSVLNENSEDENSEVCPISPRKGSSRLNTTKDQTTTEISSSLRIHTVPSNSSSEEEILCPLEEAKRNNRKIKIHIQCNCKIIPFIMKMGEQFARIFTELAKVNNKKPSEILLCKGVTTVHFQDTPAKLKLLPSDIIDCIFWNPETEKGAKKSDFINVKIQSSDTKTRSVLSIHKLEVFSHVMEEYSKLRGISLDKMSFSFDGEKIDCKKNPLELDLEDDCIIDVKIL